ncbi:MAG TPA: TolC family protein [Terriglobia bacterium]|nr:TolC family protein [Terriglobia bacterium]
MRYKRLHCIAVLSVCLWAIYPAVGLAWPGRHDPKGDNVTSINYAKGQSFLGAYGTPYVPPAKLTNSPRLEELILNGQLSLSMEDAIALALENNLNIAVARYNLPLAQTNVLRTEGGAAARSVAGASISNAVFAGALGAGLSSSSSGGGGSGLTGGGVPGTSSITCCDPFFFANYGYGNTFTPENFTNVTGVPVVTERASYGVAGVGEGFLTGTSLFAYMEGANDSSNAVFQAFNPSISSYLSIGVTQDLLQGFGYRANAVFIRIAQNEVKFSDSVFEQSVDATVDNVMTLYYDLLADREDIRVAKESLGYAQKLLSDNQTEAQIGAVAKLDVVQSEQDVATRQEDILTAENQYAQDEQSMKAAISKNFNGQLASVQINPTDRLPEPHPGDVPPLKDAIQAALGNRPEIRQAELNLHNQVYTIKQTRNALLPSLNAFATFSPDGLSGAVGPALGQLFRNKYPGYSYGINLTIPIRNRVAQADAAQALIEQRQLAMKLQQAQNQAVWDVSKAVSAVHQAQGQLDASRGVVALARESLSMEETKFKVGGAQASEVITAQTALATAEDNVVKGRATYAKALIQFEQATGTILQKNNVVLQNAIDGNVPRNPKIPGTPIGANLHK